MSNETMADTIEMLYKRLNEYHKQDLFNYGYLLESNQILCKDIEQKDKEIEKLNNVIDELERFLNYEIYCDFNKEMTKGYQDTLDKLNSLKEGK